MKTVPLHRVFLVLGCLWLAGCIALPGAKPLPPGDRDLFARGLDEYVATGDLTTLKSVPEIYPQGQWRSRAVTVIDLVEQQRKQKSGLKKMEGLDKELTACQQEKEYLKQDNQALVTTLERLKKVLIDTELQAN